MARTRKPKVNKTPEDATEPEVSEPKEVEAGAENRPSQLDQMRAALSDAPAKEEPAEELPELPQPAEEPETGAAAPAHRDEPAAAAGLSAARSRGFNGREGSRTKLGPRAGARPGSGRRLLPDHASVRDRPQHLRLAAVRDHPGAHAADRRLRHPGHGRAGARRHRHRHRAHPRRAERYGRPGQLGLRRDPGR